MVIMLIGEIIDMKDLIEIIKKIEEEHPLCCMFSDDGRDIWPERWKKIKEYATELKNTSNEWVSVKDRFPEKEGLYAIITEDWESNINVEKEYFRDYGWFKSNRFNKIIYWSELPKNNVE